MANQHDVIKHLKIEGRVQGVGFRYFTRKTAEKYSVNGWVKNMSDGTVEAVLSGSKSSVQAMTEKLKRGPSTANVTGVKEISTENYPDDFQSFTVRR
jgi:acylphosphatase